MKYVSYGIAVMKGQFIKYSPNWLFVPVYNSLLSGDTKIKIRRAQTGWLIRGEEEGDLELLSPTPKFLSVKLREFEDRFERFFKIEKGDVVLDVGACIGDTTVPMVIKAGPNGKVIAVEPDPLNARYLKLNTSRFGNVEIIEKGIWKEKGTIEFKLHKAPTGHSITGHSVGQASYVRYIGRTQIPADTLDNLFSGQRIDVAKIDVQGAEVEVLGAADNFLKSTPKIIVGTYSDSLHNAVLEVLKRYYPETRSVKNHVHAWR
jgi:FkbM family methyltransferase